MNEVIHFGLMVEINQLLKEAGANATIHSVGGCSCCGIELRVSKQTMKEEDIIQLINQFLKDKWIYVEKDHHTDNILVVKSLFK